MNPRSAAEPAVQLKKPLEQAIRLGHPWVYRDAIVEPAPPAGTVTTVRSRKGDFVGRGVADDGPIALRVFTTRDESVDESLFASRVERAVELRRRVLPEGTTAYRLLHGEGDRLPGFVCDVYGPVAVLKTDGAGALAQRDAMARVLAPALDALGATTLLGRLPSRNRTTAPTVTVLRGPAPPEEFDVTEHGMTLRVNVLRGQKTGLFLDQRESRARVRSIARGLRVLNLYGYTGGFSVAAGLGGAARVETVDVSPGAIALADATWRANGLAPDAHTTTAADVPEHLAKLARARARFDLIIADPPSFAPREESVKAALESYRALHTACLGLLAPGGYYLAASCSSHVTRSLFQQSVLSAAQRGSSVLQLLDGWGAPPDHPRLAAFPEGDYLKALLYRVG